MACTIEFYEDGRAIGRSRFTIEDAKRAGTKNMDKYPRNMLFARAMSNGVRWFCPDVFGQAVYTPEELRAGQDDVVEAVAHDEPEPVYDEPEPPEEEPRVEWPSGMVGALADAVGQPVARVEKVLEMSKVLTPEHGYDKALAWLKAYKAKREEGLEPQAAADAADAEFSE